MLRGKIAVITGGSKGIGFAIAKELITAGVTVIICSRNGKELKLAVKKLSNKKRKAFGIVADISKYSDCQRLIDYAYSKYKRIDILVNNAGTFGPIGLLETNDSKDWEKVMAINILGAVFCSKLVIPIMKKQGSGKIINLAGAGVGSTRALPRFSGYYASKAAVVAFTENLAVELKDDHIQVNAISPGAVASELTLNLLHLNKSQVGEDMYQTSKQLKAEGGTPPKLAGKLVVFLASQDSDHITGRLLSAKWDKIETLKKLSFSDKNKYRLRRIDGQLFSEK